MRRRARRESYYIRRSLPVLLRYDLMGTGARRYHPSVRPCHACTLLLGMRHRTRLLHHPVSRPCSPREPPSRPN